MKKRLGIVATIILISPATACAMSHNDAQTLLREAMLGDASALSALKSSAKSGDARAEYYLGIAYDSGQGVPQNYAKAAYWYQKAAQQGFAEAENNLGNAYYSGQGVPQNYAKGVYWFQKAAQQGYARAEYNLGVAYYHGHGVPQNSLEALHWLKKAANQNLPGAQNFIQSIERGSAG